MKKYETVFTNKRSEDSKPIYLIVKDEGTYQKTSEDECTYTETGTLFDPRKFDLTCEWEIPAMAWYTVFTESIDAYTRGELNVA